MKHQTHSTNLNTTNVWRDSSEWLATARPAHTHTTYFQLYKVKEGTCGWWLQRLLSHSNDYCNKWHIATDQLAWSVCLSVCVGSYCQPCGNGSTNQDTVLRTDRVVPRKTCVHLASTLTIIRERAAAVSIKRARTSATVHTDTTLRISLSLTDAAKWHIKSPHTVKNPLPPVMQPFFNIPRPLVRTALLAEVNKPFSK